MSSASSSFSESATSPPLVTVSRSGQGMTTALVPVPVNCNSFPKHGTLVPNRVFVGGLAASVTEDELATLFARYGHVRTVKIIVDRVGLSKGYGFVTFENEDEVQQLLKIVSSQVIVLRERKLNIAPAVRKQGIGRSLESLTTPLSPAYPNYYSSMPYLYPVTTPTVSPSAASSVMSTPTTPTGPLPAPAHSQTQVSAAATPGPPAALPPPMPASEIPMATAYYAAPTGPAASSPYPYMYSPPVYFQQYPYSAPHQQWGPGAQWQWLPGYRQASPVTQYLYFGNPMHGTSMVSDPTTGTPTYLTSSPAPNSAEGSFANLVPVDPNQEGGNAGNKPNCNTGEHVANESASQYSHHRPYYLHASEPLLTAPKSSICTPPSVSSLPPPNAPPRRASSQRWSHDNTPWSEMPWSGGGGGGGGGGGLREYSPERDRDRRRRAALDSYAWSHYRHSSEQLTNVGASSSSSPRLSPSQKLVFSPASSQSSLNLSLNETLSCPEQISHAHVASLPRAGTLHTKRRLILEHQSPIRLPRDNHRFHHPGFISPNSSSTSAASSHVCGAGTSVNKVSHMPITPPATPSINVSDLMADSRSDKGHELGQKLEQVRL